MEPSDDEAVSLAELERSVMATVAEDRGLLPAVRCLPRTARLLLLVTFLAALALLFVEFMRRRDFDEVPPVRMAAILGSLGILALGCGWGALRPLYRRPPPAWAVRAVLAVGVLVPIVVAMLPELPGPTNRPLRHVPQTFGCWATGGAVALATILFLRLLDRGGHRGRVPALLSAMAAGTTAVFCLQLECPWNATSHLLLGHAALPILAVATVWAFRNS